MLINGASGVLSRMKILDFNKNGRDKWVAEQVLKIPAGAQVLDVGVGTGPYRTLFSHCEYKTHDFAQEPDTIGKYTSLDYVSDITSIPVSSDSFDVVLCTEVLEHVPDPQLAVKRWHASLKKGGYYCYQLRLVHFSTKSLIIIMEVLRHTGIKNFFQKQGLKSGLLIQIAGFLVGLAKNLSDLVR